MIEHKLINVHDYLVENRPDIVALIVLAAKGEYEPLVTALGSERAAWDLVKTAQTYGQETKPFNPAEFPIAISPEGKLTKKTYRLAGLLLSGQQNFVAIKCGVASEVLPQLTLDKENQEKIDEFYTQLIKRASKADPKELSVVEKPQETEDLGQRD